MPLSEWRGTWEGAAGSYEAVKFDPRVAILITAGAGPRAGSRRHRLPHPGEHLRGVLAGPATAGNAAPPNSCCITARPSGAAA